MSYQNNNSKILEQYPDQGAMNRSESEIDHQCRQLEEEIEMTIYNYESLVQIEKKNNQERSQFLLYMIQNTRTKHVEELDSLKNQLQSAISEKEEAKTLEKQMENIGEGVDSIVDQGKKLKAQNAALQKELSEQIARERELDQEISSNQGELDQFRQKIDEWERIKIKWNRRKKDLIEMINSAEAHVKNNSDLNEVQEDEGDRDRDEDNQFDALVNKYKGFKKSF